MFLEGKSARLDSPLVKSFFLLPIHMFGVGWLFTKQLYQKEEVCYFKTFIFKRLNQRVQGKFQIPAGIF